MAGGQHEAVADSGCVKYPERVRAEDAHLRHPVHEGAVADRAEHKPVTTAKPIQIQERMRERCSVTCECRRAGLPRHRRVRVMRRTAFQRRRPRRRVDVPAALLHRTHQPDSRDRQRAERLPRPEARGGARRGRRRHGGRNSYRRRQNDTFSTPYEQGANSTSYEQGAASGSARL
jgi:hypothetical protein